MTFAATAATPSAAAEMNVARPIGVGLLPREPETSGARGEGEAEADADAEREFGVSAIARTLELFTVLSLDSSRYFTMM